MCAILDANVAGQVFLGGPRLLYSNDGDLQDDFADKHLIDRPRGKVYSTKERRDLRPEHRRLLANRRLCRSGGR